MLAWVVSRPATTLTGIAARLEHGRHASCLRGGVGVPRDVQDEERRNALVLRDVGDGGKVAMLCRIVAELLAMTVGRHRKMVHPGTRLGHLDDRGDVEGVGVHRHAALDHREREAFRFRVAIVRAHQRGELPAGRMAHDEHPGRVAAVRRDVLVDPPQRARDVTGDGTHVDGRQQAVVDGDEDEARHP